MLRHVAYVAYVAGPIIADIVVVTDTSGCERFKEGLRHITGHDPDTGEEFWRATKLRESPGSPMDAQYPDILK